MNEKIFEAGRILKNKRIAFLVDHIFLLPGETEGQIVQAIDDYIRLQPDSIAKIYLVYFPGTKIIDIAIEDGLLQESDRALINQGRMPFSEFSRPATEVPEKKEPTGFKIPSITWT